MRGRPSIHDRWGKLIPPERGGPAWHPLIDHSTDVACVLEALLEQPTIRRRLAAIASLEGLDRTQIARLCFLGFLHDLGKCSRGFRAKVDEAPQRTCGHIAALKPLLGDALLERFGQVVDGDTLHTWAGEALEPLLAAIFAHHGRPVWKSFHSRDRALDWVWSAAGDDDPFAHLEALVAVGRDQFASAFGGGAPLPAAPACHHLFAGLVMLADWIGSDAGAFPFTEPGDPPRAVIARECTAEVLQAVGLDPEPLRSQLANPLPTFESQFGFSPRAGQNAIDDLPLCESGGVLLLESETGSGKTEAALRYGTRLFESGLVDGIFFAVPLRSAAVQLQRRMQAWLDRTFAEGTAEALLAVPGYYRMGEAEGRPMPDFAVQWTDEDVTDRRLARWAAQQPKRYAAAPFAVGTIDQALLAVLKASHAHLRAACLVRQLLVIDEVHASDTYMQALVEKLIGLFRAAGGHVLLMSATLGAAARTRLLEGGRARPPALEQAVAVPYPLITTLFGGTVLVAADARPKRVALEYLPLIDDLEAIAARAAEAALAGARVLVLRNTVGAAIETQSALEARLGLDHGALFRVGGIVTLHHSRFAAEDRRLLDREIEAQAGRNRTPGALVLVATQTVEQSLDVDFDLLLTDVCPIDVLLQRIGRLHRHDERVRPPAFEQARCLLLGPADLRGLLGRGRHNLGFRNRNEGYAYPDLGMIEAVHRLIGGGAQWTIPADNRRLVEQGTHPDALAAIANDLGDAFVSQAQAKQGGDMAKAGQAVHHAIEFDAPFSELAFPDAEEKVATRLGSDDLILPLDHPIRSPFDQRVGHLRFPGWMIRPETWAALASDAEPLIRVAADGMLKLAEQTFIYNRLGLRRYGI